MKAGKLLIKNNLTFGEMEDDLNFFANGRGPQIFSSMEEDLKFVFKMQDDHNFSL
jgi:hypothetical protein